MKSFLLHFCHHSVTSWHLSSRRGFWAPLEGSCQQRWLRGGFYFILRATNGRHYNTDIFYAFLATTPSLRDTSPQGEAYLSPIMGSCQQRWLWGGTICFILMATNGRHYNTDIFYAFLATTPSLRDTSPQGEACLAPIMGSCQQRWLWGGTICFILRSTNGRPYEARQAWCRFTQKSRQSITLTAFTLSIIRFQHRFEYH